jgi:hypothetical protein
MVDQALELWAEELTTLPVPCLLTPGGGQAIQRRSETCQQRRAPSFKLLRVGVGQQHNQLRC